MSFRALAISLVSVGLLAACEGGARWHPPEEARTAQIATRLAKRFGHAMELHDLEFYQDGPLTVACGYARDPAHGGGDAMFVAAGDQLLLLGDPNFREVEERHCGLWPRLPLEI